MRSIWLRLKALAFAAIPLGVALGIGAALFGLVVLLRFMLGEDALEVLAAWVLGLVALGGFVGGTCVLWRDSTEVLDRWNRAREFEDDE